jgi:hypothetical protein
VGMTKLGLLLVATMLGFSCLVTRVDGGETGRFLYMATPDGAQPESKAGTGLLVFSIDDGHRFVRRIEIPSFGEGVRGLTGSPVSKCLYFGICGVWPSAV